MQTPESSVAGNNSRRNRRIRVSEEARRRSVRACTACRRVKEKCSGNEPCERCLRSGRVCEFQAVDSVARALPASRGDPSASTLASSSAASAERVRYLEKIASHFLGNISLDVDNLRQIAERIQGPDKTPADSSIADLDEFDALTLEDENFTVKTVTRSTARRCPLAAAVQLRVRKC